MSDLQCERCDAPTSYEDAASTEDGCYLCPTCDGEWRKVFAACAHAWRQQPNQWGEDSAYCDRCAAIVTLEDFPALGLAVPAGLMEAGS